MAAGEERRKDALVRSRVRRVRRALNGEVWLRAAVAPAWALATALALVRIFLRGHAWLAVPAVAAAVAVWWAEARKKRVTFSQASVVADRSTGLGGLLLTRLEVPVGGWEFDVNEALRALKPPEVRRARSAAAVSMAALFAAVAWLIPVPPEPVRRVNAAAASKLADLEAKAEALDKESRLEAEAEAELERLREELADDRFGAADWEAADTLGTRLERQAAGAAADLSRAEEAAKALEGALASSQAADGAAREKEQLERALQALAGTEADNSGQAEAGRRGSTSGASQDGGGQTAAQARGSGASKSGGGEAEAGQVSDLRRALEERQERLANAFGQQQGQSGARADGRGGSGKQSPGRAGEGTGGQAFGGAQAGASGEGHASRGMAGAPVHGGGEGELAFGAEAQMNPDRLKVEPLPPGQGGEPGELWGLRAADPKLQSAPAAAAPSGAEAAGGPTAGWKDGPLLPRNRQLLKRYFETR